jgi:hypothetical protein
LRPLNLDGHWLTDGGEEVVITHTGSTVRSTFVSGAGCPHGGMREFHIDGLLEGDQLSGKMMACTLKTKMITDCGLEPVYTVTFRGHATRRQITAQYNPDYVRYDETDGRWTNCRVDRGGGGETTFTLTRIGCDPDELAKAKELLASYEATLDLYERAKATLKPGQTFSEVQKSVKEKLAAKTKKPVTESGSTGRDILYEDEDFAVTRRYKDPDTLADRPPGSPDRRRRLNVEISSSKADPSSYPIVDQVNEEHERGHVEAIRQTFETFKQGKIEWKTWHTYSRFEGGVAEIKGYIAEEIARYAQGIKTLKDFIKKCSKPAAPRNS